MPERTISTFGVEEIGDDSSLWTEPEYGEGLIDGMAEHPLTDMQNISVTMISRCSAIVLPI